MVSQQHSVFQMGIGNGMAFLLTEPPNVGISRAEPKAKRRLHAVLGAQLLSSHHENTHMFTIYLSQPYLHN